MKFIIIIASIYLFFRYLIPIIIRFALKSTINSSVNNSSEEKEMNVGDIKIKYHKNNKTDLPKKSNKDDEGEYVHFEEIK